MDFSKLEAGMRITCKNYWAFENEYYTLVTAESTYVNAEDCPEHERGQLMIIEFMNSGKPMFFPMSMLKPNEWEIYEDDE